MEALNRTKKNYHRQINESIKMRSNTFIKKKKPVRTVLVKPRLADFTGPRHINQKPHDIQPQSYLFSNITNYYLYRGWF